MRVCVRSIAHGLRNETTVFQLVQPDDVHLCALKESQHTPLDIAAALTTVGRC